MSGMYRHLLTVKRETKTRTSLGDWSTTEAAVTTFYAAISPASADLRMEYMQRKVVVTHQVFARGRPDVRAQDILEFGPRRFRVHGVIDPGELGRHLELACEDVNPPAPAG